MKGSSTVITERAVGALRPYARNARTHSKKQIKQIARSIERFGFTNPVLVSDEGEIIVGHGRVEAARLLGWTKVPTIALSHLSETERRAYVLADNKLALKAGWDKEITQSRGSGRSRAQVPGHSPPSATMGTARSSPHKS